MSNRTEDGLQRPDATRQRAKAHGGASGWLRAHRAEAVLLAALALVIGHRLADFTGIRFVVYDDTWTGLIPLRDAFEAAWAHAVRQGRVFYLSPTGVLLPQIWLNNLGPGALYDVLSLGGVVVTSLLSAYAVARYWSAAAGWLLLLAFWALLPQLWNHMPPAAGGAAPFLPFALTILAAIGLWHYGQRRSWPWLAVALTSYCASLVSAELFVVLSSGLFALALIAVHRRFGWRRRHAALVAGAALGLLAAYLVVYAHWREAHPSQYTGNQVDLGNPLAVAQTLAQYVVGGSIFRYWFDTYTVNAYDAATESRYVLAHVERLGGMLRAADWMDWLSALVGGALAGALVWRERAALAASRARPMLLAGMWVAASAVALYAVTRHFQDWVRQGDQAYLGSRYAYFGVLLAGLALVVALLRAMRGRFPALVPWLAGAVALLVGLGSVSTSGFNNAVARSMRVQSAKWWALQAVEDCPALATQVSGQTIVAPRLRDYVQLGAYTHANLGYWDAYYAHRTGQDAQFLPGVPPGASQPLQFDYRLDASGRMFAVLLGVPGAGDAPGRLYVLNRRGGTVAVVSPGGAGLGEPERRSACGGTLAIYPLGSPAPNLTALSVEHSTRRAFHLTPQQIASTYAMAGGVGARIGFGPAGEGFRHFREGWHIPEPWGTWSSGSHAALQFRLTDPPEDDIVLIAQGQVFVPASPPVQSVTVVANDQPVATWTFAPQVWRPQLRATIPSSLLGPDGALRIVFQIAQPTSPHSVYGGDDHRLLGFGLISLRLLENGLDGAVLPLHEQVAFRAQDNGAKYVEYGWFEPEPWGMWSAGERAGLLMRLEERPAGDLRLVAFAHALVPRARPQQEVTVKANGQPIAVWTFTSNHATREHRATIPAATVDTRGMLRLTFEIAHPVSPQSLGLNEDARPLGMGLVSLRLERAAAPR